MGNYCCCERQKKPENNNSLLTPEIRTSIEAKTMSDNNSQFESTVSMKDRQNRYYDKDGVIEELSEGSEDEIVV